MHISKLNLVNYRNFSNTELLFNKGINTVIGENGSGKTNLFRAIRLLLDDNMLRSAYKLDEKDFNRSLGPWQGHWIIISIEFEELSLDEEIQALFIHGAANIQSGTSVDKATYNLIFRPKKDIRLKLSKLHDGDHNGLKDILSEMVIGDYETIFTGKSGLPIVCLRRILAVLSVNGEMDIANVLVVKGSHLKVEDVRKKLILSIALCRLTCLTFILL